MSYIDGFLLPVPTKNLKAYQQMSKKAGKVWKEHGALEYKEAAGDDLDLEGFAPFSKSVKAKRNETLVFAFILYKSRKHRDSVNKKVMEDPRMTKICGDKEMPFDVKRMMYGGFKSIVDM